MLKYILKRTSSVKVISFYAEIENESTIPNRGGKNSLIIFHSFPYFFPPSLHTYAAIVNHLVNSIRHHQHFQCTFV